MTAWFKQTEAPESPKRDVISVEEATELLPMSKRVIYERVRKGELPGFKVGRRTFMRRSEIENLLRGVPNG